MIAHEGRWLGAETFVSFDRKAVEMLAAQAPAGSADLAAQEGLPNYGAEWMGSVSALSRHPPLIVWTLFPEASLFFSAVVQRAAKLQPRSINGCLLLLVSFSQVLLEVLDPVKDNAVWRENGTPIEPVFIR